MSLISYVMLLASFFFSFTLAAYNLADDYSGDSFFQGWDFFTAADPTNGHVLYQSKTVAAAKGLISIRGNTTGSVVRNATRQVFVGVDSSSQAPNGRPSIRIATQKTYQHALVLADIAHQPGGICGVWPAFWMVGANWPDMGEIDIVEGVSTQATNQMTLHTNAGPVLDRHAEFSGDLLTANCDVKAPNQPKNVGCGIADDSNITFGGDFNAIGGGVYATEWTSSFIKIWFFPRNKIPRDIQRGSPVPGKQWGRPSSLFQGNFKVDDHFKNLQIVLNTAFCGDWAGAVWSQTPECAALAPTCNDYVTKNPKAFEQAFWLINSIKVFQDNGSAADNTTTTARPRPTGTKTITETRTIYTSATNRPQPPVNGTRPTSSPLLPPSQTSDSKSMAAPGMVFGIPGFYHERHRHRNKRAHGGSVLHGRY